MDGPKIAEPARQVAAPRAQARRGLPGAHISGRRAEAP